MKGWLDNYGKEENPNDSKMKGPNIGITIKGRNYSPAWGGQFQNGGGMPGSVGFSYARTKGIPSNGKYAKMTLASAQGGMTSRQKRGIELTLKDYAQEQKEKAEMLKTGTIKNPQSIKYKATKKVFPDVHQDTRTKEEIVKAAEAMDRVQEGNLYGELPLLALADPTKLLGAAGVPGYEGFEKDRQRILMNREDPNLHPSERFQRHLEMGLEEVPSAALNVGLSTMAAGEARGIVPNLGKVMGEALNPIPLPFNVGMKDASTFWRNLKNQDDIAGLLEGNREVRRFMDRGADFSQDTGVGSMIDFETGAKYPYNTDTKKLVQDEYVDDLKKYFDSPEFNRKMDNNPQIDREMYKQKSLENLQQKLTIDPTNVGPSALGEYKPKISYNQKVLEYTRGARVPLSKKLKLANTYLNEKIGSIAGRSFVKENPGLEEIKHELRHQQTNVDELLPEYLTEDYIKENLHKNLPAKIEENLKDFTHESEVDTRIKLMKEDIKKAGIADYFKEPITEEHIKALKDNFDAQSRASNQLFHMFPTKFLSENAEKLFALPPAIGAATQIGGGEEPATGVFPRMRGGGVIDDNRGQWAHPGEITRIDGTDITMRGVPYDVLGISDTGDTKLMKSGKNYKFKGNNVTEFPKAKNGKELTKLDQLTNFTNYNTPQPGGWLDNL